MYVQLSAMLVVASLTLSDAIIGDLRRVVNLGLSDAVRRHKLRLQVQPMTLEEIQYVVDRHNELRAQEGADNMEMLSWNQSLARLAETWAGNCVWKHPIPKQNYPEYAGIGQNLYCMSVDKVNNFNLKGGIQPWYDEKYDYNYETKACSGKACGHYEQLVWATSHQIGCAYHKCTPLSPKSWKSGMFFVCNYWPHEATSADQKVFTKGAACSKCRTGAGWCTNGLCNNDCSGPCSEDCSCAVVCYNCATLDQQTCRCSCADGWLGDDCSVRCEDSSSMCDPAPGQPGYNPSECSDPTSVVHEDCPVWCGLCTPDPGAKAGACPPVHAAAAGSPPCTTVSSNVTSSDNVTHSVVTTSSPAGARSAASSTLIINAERATTLIVNTQSATLTMTVMMAVKFNVITS